jgi:hypothetical protein
MMMLLRHLRVGGLSCQVQKKRDAQRRGINGAEIESSKMEARAARADEEKLFDWIAWVASLSRVRSGGSLPSAGRS